MKSAKLLVELLHLSADVGVARVFTLGSLQTVSAVHDFGRFRAKVEPVDGVCNGAGQERKGLIDDWVAETRVVRTNVWVGIGERRQQDSGETRGQWEVDLQFAVQSHQHICSTGSPRGGLRSP